jgi:hypothetical protein
LAAAKQLGHILLHQLPIGRLNRNIEAVDLILREHHIVVWSVIVAVGQGFPPGGPGSAIAATDRGISATGTHQQAETQSD